MSAPDLIAAQSSSGIVEDLALDAIEAEGWTVGDTLGQGTFGRVVQVTRKSDGVQAACKIIELPDDEDEKKAIDNEMMIMKALAHPGIVNLYHGFESDTHAFMTLELCKGGELFDRIVALKSFNETMAASVTYTVLVALEYMHGKGIVHRDLKPENLLLADETPESTVKIADFGTSHLMDAESSLMTEPAGTLQYIAPEILKMRSGGGYDRQCDVWSLGVILYILVSGRPPFSGKTEKKLSAAIKKGAYSPLPEAVSAPCRRIIQRMLWVDPAERATIAALLDDPWLAGAAQEAQEAEQQQHGAGLPPPLSPRAPGGGGALSPRGGAAGGAAGEVNLMADPAYHLKETEQENAMLTNHLPTYRAKKKIRLLLAMNTPAIKRRAAELASPRAAGPLAASPGNSEAEAPPPTADAGGGDSRAYLAKHDVAAALSLAVASAVRVRADDAVTHVGRELLRPPGPAADAAGGGAADARTYLWEQGVEAAITMAVADVLRARPEAPLEHIAQALLAAKAM